MRYFEGKYLKNRVYEIKILKCGSFEFHAARITLFGLILARTDIYF